MIPLFFRHSHWLFSLLVMAALVPAVNAVTLPLRWDLGSQFAAFVMLGFKSASLAAVLYAVQFPQPVMRYLRDIYWRDKPRLMLTSLFAVALIPSIGASLAGVSTINTLALFVLWKKYRDLRFFKRMVGLLPAAIYLFLGLVVVFTYNAVIVRVRFYGTYDAYLFNLDKLFLGTTVPAISDYAASLFPTPIFSLLDSVYFGMFVQIGAALYLCGISSGWRQAARFVGTILLSYYVALVLFYFLPAKGPYYFSGGLLCQQLPSLESCDAQKSLVAVADHLWQRRPLQIIPSGYYISFPCMHIVQPIIVLWFLRRWERVVTLLLIYDAVLVAAILLLNWHYAVDIVGGVAVAVVAILLTIDRSENLMLSSPALQRPFSSDIGVKV